MQVPPAAGEEEEDDDEVDSCWFHVSRGKNCLMLQNCICAQRHTKQTPKMSFISDRNPTVCAPLQLGVCVCVSCLDACTCAPSHLQYYTHSLQPHSTGFSTSCVNEVPSSHSKASRRRRTLRGEQQEAAAAAPGTVPAWHRPQHSTQEKGLEVWQRTVPRCSRW